jgi:hypothetical protein
MPPEDMEAQHGASRVRIVGHRIALFAEKGSEAQFFGMYTYVLFSRETADQTDEVVLRRYKALLAALKSSTERKTSGPREDTSKLNVFCIPVKRRAYSRRVSGDVAATLDSYNSQLAMSYLEMVAQGVPLGDRLHRNLLINAGPFLVSTSIPIPELAVGEPLLVADLTNTNSAAMREVVNVYKAHILAEGAPQAIKEFQSFRLHLLTIVLDADEHVRILVKPTKALAGENADEKENGEN